PPEGNKIAFRNLVRTDGHTLEFLCERKSRERLPDLVMSDLDDNDMVEFWSYGVDPGHTVPFTAVDSEKNCLRFTNNEFYAKSGYKKRRYHRQLSTTESGMNIALNSLPTKKTVSSTRWTSYCQSLCETLPVLYQFYGSSFTNARFLAYVSKQKVLDEMVNIFAFGGKKYKEHDVL
ncbi:hypothetical protein DM01DRAFT_1278305, partial [Hesseltinella vesiculosa]